MYIYIYMYIHILLLLLLLLLIIVMIYTSRDYVARTGLQVFMEPVEGVSKPVIR